MFADGTYEIFEYTIYVWGAATNQLTDRTTVTGQDSSVGVIWRFSGRHGLNQKQAYGGASR